MMFKKLLLVSTMLVGGGLLTAEASPVLSFTPSSQSVYVGDSFSVSAVLSGLESGGLNQALTAFDVTVNFDALILDNHSVSITTTPYGGNAISWNATFGASSTNWNILSYLDDSTLQGLQGDSITLGTLGFHALAAGTSALSFSWDDLTGLGGLALDHTLSSGSVTVLDRNGTTPEPATMLLIGLGALGMSGVKRIRAKA